MSALETARFLPDGSILVHDRDIEDRLRNGDATLGWEGDPTLRLVFNTPEERWEVWEDGVDGPVMWNDSPRLPGVELIREIVAHDTRHVDVVGQVLAANAKRDRDAAARQHEASADAADRMAFALAKDLGLPAPDGRLYPTSGK